MLRKFGHFKKILHYLQCENKEKTPFLDKLLKLQSIKKALWVFIIFVNDLIRFGGK